jgi:hypothetical protein
MVSEIQQMANTSDSANLSQTYQTAYGICDPSHSHMDSAYLSHLGCLSY